LKNQKEEEPAAKYVKRRLQPSYVLNAVLLIAVVILAYPKIFKRNSLDILRLKDKIIVAVMPFQNLTNDTVWDIWQGGIQDELITSLTFSDELGVSQAGGFLRT